jgi:uncharacterized protein (TIGR00290 family)
MAQKVLFSWSGGKDSALALYRTLNDERYDVAGLLTTVNEGYHRISMHGVLESLLEQQAESIGLPMHRVYLPQESSNEEYEARMERELLRQKDSGISAVAFGDIFLFEIKRYREENLSKIGMQGIFPLWGRTDCYKDFIELGFKAVVASADAKVLDGTFPGRMFDGEFVAALPRDVDPNGENGEFHTFVFDGPIFRHSIPYTAGEVVQRDGFYYCDIRPQADTD